MKYLAWKALWELLRYDILLRRATFAEVHQLARAIPLSPYKHDANAETICRAIDWAAIWYWKRVLCLQRSFVAVRMLRRYGVKADMVIGAQRLPFRAHAWVEVKSIVVNDRSSVQQRYAVLERC